MDGYLAKVGYQLDFKFFQGKLVILVEDQWGGGDSIPAVC